MGQEARSAASVNPVATELHAEFPLLWEQAQAFDFAERLGGCSDPLLAEIDRAMRELWLARTNLAVNERLREALTYYAEGRYPDGGEIARQALDV